MQRAKPLDLRDLGIRLGMTQRFEALLEREAAEDWPAVTRGLVGMLAELDAEPSSRLVAADLLEVLGAFCSRSAEETEATTGAPTPTTCWGRCLAIRSEGLGPAHAETVIARFMLGSWLAHSGDHEGALRLLRENLEHRPGPDPSGVLPQQLAWTARALRVAGRNEEALDCWNRGLELIEGSDADSDSNRARALASRAVVFHAMDRLPEARRDFEAALTSLEARLPAAAHDLAGIAQSYASMLAHAGDLEGAELAHQLQVVVGLRHGMIPMGRTFTRPPMSPDLERKIKAVWDRFALDPKGAGARTGKGWVRRVIDRLRGMRPQPPSIGVH